MSLCRVSNCIQSTSLVNKSANCFTPSKCSNIGNVPHVFQVAMAPLALYQHLKINMTRPRNQNSSLICQRYIDWSRKPIVHYKVLPVRNHVVQRTRITYPLIRKSHAIHSYFRKRRTSGIVHWWWAHAVCHLWFILVTFQFPAILFQMANLPTMKTDVIFSVVFGWPLRPTWFTRRCSDRHRLRRRGWRMCHECTWLCRCRRRLQSFFDRTQCIKQTARRSLVVIDSQKLLNSWYWATVARICPYSSSIGMSCDLRRWSFVFMSGNNFSTLATYAAMSIYGSRWSFKNSVINRVAECSFHTHW